MPVNKEGLKHLPLNAELVTTRYQHAIAELRKYLQELEPLADKYAYQMRNKKGQLINGFDDEDCAENPRTNASGGVILYSDSIGPRTAKQVHRLLQIALCDDNGDAVLPFECKPYHKELPFSRHDTKIDLTADQLKTLYLRMGFESQYISPHQYKDVYGIMGSGKAYFQLYPGLEKIAVGNTHREKFEDRRARETLEDFRVR
jgi:hypothetical protein